MEPPTIPKRGQKLESKVKILNCNEFQNLLSHIDN